MKRTLASNRVQTSAASDMRCHYIWTCLVIKRMNPSLQVSGCSLHLSIWYPRTRAQVSPCSDNSSNYSIQLVLRERYTVFFVIGSLCSSAAVWGWIWTMATLVVALNSVGTWMHRSVYVLIQNVPESDQRKRKAPQKVLTWAANPRDSYWDDWMEVCTIGIIINTDEKNENEIGKHWCVGLLFPALSHGVYLRPTYVMEFVELLEAGLHIRYPLNIPQAVLEGPTWPGVVLLIRAQSGDRAIGSTVPGHDAEET